MALKKIPDRREEARFMKLVALVVAVELGDVAWREI
jgi:hypothetical protein